MRGEGVEQDERVVAEADVLRPLAHAEADLSGPLPVVPARDLEDLVLEPEAGQLLAHRRLLVERDLRPSLANVLGGQGHRRLRAQLARPARGGHGTAVGALDRQGSSDPGLVHDLDQEEPRPALDQLGWGRPPRHLDPALGVDLDHQEHVAVEQGLDLGGARRLVRSPDRAVDPLVILGAQGLAEVREGVFQEPHLLGEGLQGNCGRGRATRRHRGKRREEQGAEEVPGRGVPHGRPTRSPPRP